MKYLASLFMAGAVVWPCDVWADCGSIPFLPDAEIFEPGQRAVIAFDGKEEILVLSTDLRASKPTKVLEVIPFPTEPKVAQAEPDVYDKAAALIAKKLGKGKGKGLGMMGGFGAGGPARPPAGEVTQRKKIGAHDLSVIRVLDSDRFVRWVEDYLRNAGVENPKIPRPLKQVIVEYLRDGFTWFVFDVVQLGTETVTKDAIQYRFATRFAYYPLRITRAETGATRIRLLMISPRLLQIPDIGTAKVRLMHEPVRVDAEELKYIDEEIHKMLGDKRTTLMRIWEIKGPLARFQRDVVTSWY